MSEIRLSADGERALRESEAFCFRMNVAIQVAEHLLAGALVVLGEAGLANLPSREQLEHGLEAIHSRGSEPLKENVMPGPAMRAALSLTAAAVSRSGGTIIDAAIIARGCIASGEINPMFYSAIGTSKDALADAL